MYSLDDYGAMIADSVRIGPYMQAIEAAVRPGNVVVDLGSGPGFFALIACRAGARRVYAIDLDEIVQFGRHFATANSFTDRIEFLQGDSRQIQLPERADVIVSDIRGALPFSGHSMVSLEDARQRFLVEGGTMIPQRDTLYAAIVESEKSYYEIRSPWQSSDKGLDLSPALSYVLNDRSLNPHHAGAIGHRASKLVGDRIHERVRAFEPRPRCIFGPRAEQPRTELLSGLTHNSSGRLASRARLAAPKRSTAIAFCLGSSRSRSPQGKKFKSSCTPTSLVEITSGAGRPRFVKRGKA